MVRPAYMSYVASPAAMSFNFAIQSYHPHQSNSSSKRNQGAQGAIAWVQLNAIDSDL